MDMVVQRPGVAHQTDSSAPFSADIHEELSKPSEFSDAIGQLGIGWPEINNVARVVSLWMD
jgi:hypothetical protein